MQLWGDLCHKCGYMTQLTSPRSVRSPPARALCD
ncbi:hypothetical protein PQA65_gp19 [Yersinia phage vB_YenM_42.18]|uniref:Uncharacterized protein n=1 Tax=Yersinia phage vB_YenM_42.18 TaxID=2918926 RepID=A0AAE9JWM8_9CAUD|nr:hypothetical protein PQA65_gp19 [Yersinia phage vB_YenM_42.18]UNA05733.1 hypothetical protein vBYenM4218_019 [Yersinia phage vB_YenM_42.18]